MNLKSESSCCSLAEGWRTDGLLRQVPSRSGNAVVKALIAVSILAVVGSVCAAGQVGVSSTGTSTYSRSIEVPPGAGGLSPQIGLSYAGGSSNGPLGYGWSVQGLSAITRCGATMALDGKRSAVTYGPSDKLCLDGLRLVQTNEAGSSTASANAVNVAVSSQANDARGLAPGLYRELRTHKDTFSRIRGYGYANGDTSGASGPAYFKVWMKSGQIFEYGATPNADGNTNALITRAGSSNGAMAWALARISDSAGNFIDFKYEQRALAWGTGATAGSPTVGREWDIREIQYSGNKVVFNYATNADGSDVRTDRVEAYHHGTKTLSARRLSSITTYVNSANTSALGAAAGAVAVKTLALQYDKGPVSGRSRVVTIRECAGGPASSRCLPADTFTYYPGSGDAFVASPVFSSDPLWLTPLQTSDGKMGTLAFDVDGDGKTDLMRWGDAPANNKLWLSNGDGTFRPVAAFNISDNLFRSDSCYVSFVTDVDGDGLQDIVRYSPATQPSRAPCQTTDKSQYAYLNKGDGTFTRKPLTGVTLSSLSDILIVYTACSPLPQCMKFGTAGGGTFYLLDVNGDGKADIIMTASPAVPLGASSSPCTGCTRVFIGDGTGAFAETASNLANQYLYNWNGAIQSGNWHAGWLSRMDVDGDGLLDVVIRSLPLPGGSGSEAGPVSTTSVWRSKGDGSFDPPVQSQTLNCAKALDFNGDGKSDCNDTTLMVATDDTVLQAVGGSNTSTLANFSTSNFVAGDFNGDGLEDLLGWQDTASNNTLYLSNGDGTFRISSTFNLGGSTALQLATTSKSYGLIVGDFTGRGSLELLRTVSNPVDPQTSGSLTMNVLLTKADAIPADLLESVRTGSGATSKLYYAPLGNPNPGSASASLGSRYHSDRGNSAYAVPNAVDVTPPLYVVVTRVSDSGVGSATVSTEYSYAGFKVDRNGRGSLGFRDVLVQTVAPNGNAMTTDTQYVQVHPYIGAVGYVRTYRTALNALTSSQQLSDTTNVYCDRTNTAAASGSAHCPVSSKVARPYLYQSTQTGFDLDRTAMPKVVTVNQFTDTGDPLQVTVTITGSVAGVSQTFVRTTDNGYFAADTSCSAVDNCAWVLGRLDRSTVSNSVPNSLDAIPRSAGNAANASATQGSVP